MPADFRVSITNAPGADAYPIASFTWILLYDDLRRAGGDHEGIHALGAERWTEDGAGAWYASLPPQVVEMEMKALEQLKVQ